MRVYQETVILVGRLAQQGTYRGNPDLRAISRDPGVRETACTQATGRLSGKRTWSTPQLRVNRARFVRSDNDSPPSRANLPAGPPRCLGYRS